MGEFVGLDAEVAGTGDEFAQPADAWVHQQIAENAEILTAGLDGASCTFWQVGLALDAAPDTNQGDRPWLSIDWSSPVRIPFVLTPGLSSVDIDCGWIVNILAGSNRNVSVEWTLFTSGGTRLARVKQDLISTSVWDDVGTRAHRFQLDLDSPYGGEEDVGTLRLRIRSEVGEYASVDYDLEPGVTRPRRPTNIARDLPANSNPPVAGDSMVIGLYSDAHGVALDILGLDRQTSPAPYLVYVDPEWPAATGGAAVGMAALHLPFIQCRWIFVRPVYDEASLTGIVPESLQARRPVLSSQTTPVHLHPKNYHRRPRLLAWGPSGYIPPNRPEKWPARVHTRFQRVRASASPDVVVDVPLVLPWDSGALDICIDVAAIYGENVDRPGVSGSSSWTFTAEILQQNAAVNDWSSADALAEATVSEVPIDTYPTYPAGKQRMLVSEGILRFTSGTVTADNIGFPYKEGQIFSEDEQLLRRIVVSLSDTELDMSTCYRVRLRATYVADSLDGYPALVYSGLDPLDRLYLVCTGFSIWGVGR